MAILTGLLITPPYQLALAAPAVSTTAATNPFISVIHNLQKVETLAYRASTTFYLHNVLNRDPQQLRKMQAALSEGDQLIALIGNPALTLKWGELKTACTSTKYTKDGAPESASLNAVDNTLSSLVTAVEANISEQRNTGKITIDKMKGMLYDQYVTMQIMTSTYLHDAADSFGGGVFYTESDSVDIEELAKKFDTQQAQLSKYYSNNPQVSLLLKDVKTRWVFVRKSMVNYNEKSAPFVIGHYNEQITNKLLQAFYLIK